MEPTAPTTTEAYLICLSGERVGTMVKIDGEAVVGRARDATLRLVGNGISRQHLRIEATPVGLKLQDLGSRNGTFVNGRRIRKPVLLTDGDKIMVGDTVILKFSYADSMDAEFQRRMYDSAIRDALTGLHNRRYLMDRIQSEFSYSRRHETPLAVAILDLDHFKQINDSYGHLTGDTVLRSFGEIASCSCRTEDVVARYGGEEFALLLRGLTEAQGCAAAERLRTKISETPLCAEQPGLRVTISAGVAALPCSGIDTPEALIDAADKALYRSKAAGRNQVTGHSQPQSS